MPKIQFTVEEVASYAKDEPEYHHYHQLAIKIAKSMSIHANGEYPKEMIEERRPHESDQVREYREKIWKPITKSTFTKVFNELQKIRKSSDWSVNYEGLDQYPKIIEDEDLEEYCEKNYPYFKSLTNWCFSDLLRQILIDPNAIVVVRPLEEEVAETGFVRPIARIYNSKNVLKFIADDYAVIRLDDACEYKVENTVKKGRSIIIVTTVEFLRYDQTTTKGDYNLVEQWQHGLGKLPVFQLKGVLVETEWPYFLYESRIAGMVPYLDEAIREYSDLQAAKVLHVHPERWEFIQRECPDCMGTGVMPNPKWFDGCDAAIKPTCGCSNKDCVGGYLANGPYSKLLIRPMNSATETGSAMPTPPAGFIEKDVEIVKLMDSGIRQHRMDALAAINFEFLAEVPLDQSGVAKEMDYDALNNTVHSIAEDIVSVMDQAIHLIAKYRYSGLYSEEDIIEMLPDIPVPERFDIAGSSRIMAEIASAKTNEANPVIKSALEIDYASKRFNNNPEIRDMVSLVLMLDPLQNISEDNKMSRLSNKGITLESYVISSNIEEFIKRAILEEKDFTTWPVEKQKEKLEQYAAEIIEANEAKSQSNMIAMQAQMQMQAEDELNNLEDETDVQTTAGDTVNDQQGDTEV